METKGSPEDLRKEIQEIKLWPMLKKGMVDNAVSTDQEFTLASGRTSSFYVDCRLASCIPEVGRVVGGALDFSVQLIMGRSHDVAIAPVPMGGILLLARMMSMGSYYSRDIPWLIPRIEKKDHGRKQSVEGLYGLDGSRLIGNSSKVLALEDVCTSGGSSLRAVNVLREEGLNVVGVLALVDRQEGAEELLRENGLQLWSVLRKEDFMQGGKS